MKRKTRIILKLTIVAFLMALTPFREQKDGLYANTVETSAGKPWVQEFTPKRQFYVSPTGSGTGLSQATPMSLSSAIKNATAGDLYWLLGGTYTGRFVLNKRGNPENPIVFRAFGRNHVLISGTIEIRGAYNWVWGLEINDLQGLVSFAQQDSGVRMLAAGVHVINNVIHHQPDKNGIGAWNKGPGQVVYGNIVYDNGQGPNHPHNIYTQNDFSKFGYKYIVNNMFLDSASVCNQCFNVNAYTTNTSISGLHFERNIIKNGRFLVGGYGTPAANEVVIENYFYDTQAQFGFRRPAQVEFRNNYLARATLNLNHFWGLGETRFRQTAPNVITGNEIVLPRGNHVDLRTSAYFATVRLEGDPKLQPTDVFNNNKYSSPFRASLFANKVDLGRVTFAQWRTATAAAGNAFDTLSTVSPRPHNVKIVLLPNEYDRGRAHLVIYNWDKRPNVSVDLSSIVSNGQSFEVLKAKEAFGVPVQSGIYNGPVSIPIQKQEFGVYLIRRL